MNKPINCRKFFLVVGIVLISAALIFRGYVEYQKRVHNLNLQIGHSLYPVVSDYFSWSKEEPLKPGELPKRGEFYSYRRPESAAKKPMEKFYQRLSGGRTATKQCHGVSEDGLLWDTGSDDKWVPTADIVGHVVEIYDSKYRKLSKTPEGRLRLWVERHNLPTNRYVSEKFTSWQMGSNAVANLNVLRDAQLDPMASIEYSKPIALRPSQVGNNEVWEFDGSDWKIMALDARIKAASVTTGTDCLLAGGVWVGQQVLYALVLREGKVKQRIETGSIKPTRAWIDKNGDACFYGDSLHAPSEPGGDSSITLRLKKTIYGEWQVKQYN